MPLAPGNRIARYEVRELLGAGGMGEVYKAWDPDLERHVAIKILREDSEDRLRRFAQEAKTASALHHPNVAHVYEFGIDGEQRFIAMELVEGETLRERLGRGPMPLEEITGIASQIAGALAAAHKQGIVHRDIKPENIIITPEHYAKVLDFGLAKLREMQGDDAATIIKTSPHLTMGTLAYMAPEQLVGGEVTPASDVFSFGVVLYEMVAGRRPFEGTTTTDVISAILTRTPRPLVDTRPDAPAKLGEVIARALMKDVEERFRDAGQVYDAIRDASRDEVFVPARKSGGMAAALKIAVVLAILAGIGASVWKFIGVRRERDAVRKLDEAENLLRQRKLYEAYEMAMTVSVSLPADSRVRDLISRSSDRLVVESDPPGATVYVQRFKGPPQRTRLGVTPLTVPRIARAEYLLIVEKRGYARGVRPISTMPLYNRGEARLVETPPVRIKLAPLEKTPRGMVFVEGGPYRLAGYHRPSDRVVELSDYFIDRTEVTNREFEEFVRDAGYRRPELWKHAFTDGAKTLSFDDAMERFRDTTGMPGPRSWSGGVPPAGKRDHPVTDVTWYEAAAFAEWKGKKLPTIYQWEKAARHPATSSFANTFPWGFVSQGQDASERANFRGNGSVPVSTMPFGASPYGALHMAGNVAEWCRNPNAPGHSARGGAWPDAMYAFGQTAAFPSFYSAPTLGFRCVTGASGEEGDFALNPSGFVPAYEAVDDETFAGFRKLYEYEATPLEARVVQRIEAPDWTREKIIYKVGDKSVPAYLYLPRRFPRPLQVIHFFPAGDVVYGWRTLPHSIEIMLPAIIRSGRAVFAVELEGFIGRPTPPAFVRPDPDQAEYTDWNIERATEMRRGLDYLASRPDIDSSRIALLGISAGGGPGVFVSALESRYRSVIFSGTGIATREGRYRPEANRIHFVPRIAAPKMMLHGRYDEDTSLKSEAEPMFRLMTEPKRLVVFEGGHVPSSEVAVPAITNWLDETMGKV